MQVPAPFEYQRATISARADQVAEAHHHAGAVFHLISGHRDMSESCS